MLTLTASCLTAACTDGEAQLGSAAIPKNEPVAGGEHRPLGKATRDEHTSNAAETDDADNADDAVVPPNVDIHRRLAPDAPAPGEVDYVLLISVDGLAPRFLQQLLGEDKLPAFAELGRDGARTFNARTDTSYTNTLPNHTSMLTGLPVLAPPGAPATQGHGYVFNGGAGTEVTLHNSGNPARTYTPSVFDVAHDHGLSTALFASKTKFDLYTNSYNGAGAPDTTGEDNGPEKIDLVEIDVDPQAMTDSLVAALASSPPNFSFVHFSQPDVAGHGYGWGEEEYLAALGAVDAELERILDVVQTSAPLAGHTAVILTTDHGGTSHDHQDAANPLNFVIPFYVLSPGIQGNHDLYDLAAAQRVAPPTDANPSFDSEDQPIRNGDAGNLALELLGLPPVPDSSMHTLGLASASAE